MTEVRHPIFARFYTRLSTVGEKKGAAEHRAEMLSGLRGTVVEVGAGNGLNFTHYPAEVTRVVAVEPEPYLRARAEEASARSAVPIVVVDGTADSIPSDDAAFDAGVASLVLCSVPDQATALAELKRVIRPGGELRFYEHVLADDDGFARFQHAAARVVPRLGGGCHPNRDTVAAIERAGFVVESCRRFAFRPALLAYPMTPHVLGTARRP